jgi:hypothetical protein
MTDKEILAMAVELVLDSTNIIIQSKDTKGDVMVFKFHKLDCPNVRISLALNGEIECDKQLTLDQALPVLCDAIKYAG